MVDNTLTEKVLLATGGYDHTIKLWHANTGVCNRSLTHLDSVSLLTSSYIFNLALNLLNLSV